MSGSLDDMLEKVKKSLPPPGPVGRNFADYNKEQQSKVKDKADKESIVPKVNYLEDE